MKLRDTSAPPALASAESKESNRAKRTPLPFWKMICADGNTKWLPYVKGQDRAVTENPTDRPAPSNASARAPLNMYCLAQRGRHAPCQRSARRLLGPVDPSTHRRCRKCGRVYLLDNFVRSSTVYGPVRVDWKTCNPCTRTRRDEKISDAEYARRYQGRTE